MNPILVSVSPRLKIAESLLDFHVFSNGNVDLRILKKVKCFPFLKASDKTPHIFFLTVSTR